MSSMPMPFFATRGAMLYTERIRSEKDSFRKDYNNSRPTKNAHRYSVKMMNSIWGLYNNNAPFQFQKNLEISTNKFNLIGAQIDSIPSNQ